MRPEEIQRAIKKAGLSQGQIARKINRSEMSVSQVIHKKIISNFIMQAVADSIDCRIIDVFPEYFSGPKYRKTSQTALVRR